MRVPPVPRIQAAKLLVTLRPEFAFIQCEPPARLASDAARRRVIAYGHTPRRRGNAAVRSTKTRSRPDASVFSRAPRRVTAERRCAAPRIRNCTLEAPSARRRPNQPTPIMFATATRNAEVSWKGQPSGRGVFPCCVTRTSKTTSFRLGCRSVGSIEYGQVTDPSDEVCGCGQRLSHTVISATFHWARRRHSLA